MNKKLLEELIKYLNEVSDTVEVPRKLRIKAYGLSIRINTEETKAPDLELVELKIPLPYETNRIQNNDTRGM